MNAFVVMDERVLKVLAAIVVPCLFPEGETCSVAAVDEFGPLLAEKFLSELDRAGYAVVKKPPELDFKHGGECFYNGESLGPLPVEKKKSI